MATAAVQIQRFYRHRTAMFDPAGTQTLRQLYRTPREARDSAWFSRFHDAAWFAALAEATPAVQTGPDGMPYLRLDLPKPADRFDPHCLANRAGDCLTAGIGAAFFAHPDDPPEAAEYVFPFGELDSLLRFDSPDGDPVDVTESALPPAMPPRRGWFGRMPPRQVLLAAPSEEFLPSYVAKALHAHLTATWGLKHPRVQMLTDFTMRPYRHLVIGARARDFPPGTDIAHAMQYVLWHLPQHRSVVLMTDDMRLEQMTPLRDLFAGASGL